MPTPNDLLNSRIALAKGWRYVVHDLQKQIVVPPACPNLPPKHPGLAIWYDPQNRQSERPDFVGTLEGVSGMLRELNEDELEDTREIAIAYCDWSLRWSSMFQIWDMYGEDEISDKRVAQFQSTKEEGPGIAVGKAWMSVFGRENASTRT